MAITNQNTPIVHRKEWQMMTPAPVVSSAGSFVINSYKNNNDLSLFVLNSTTHYLYSTPQDSWVQIPSMALAGTFGGGSCGTQRRWSNTLTANGGSTTTATTTAIISSLGVGRVIRFLTGANAGIERTISNIIVNASGTSTIQFTALPSAVANTDTFAVDSGLFLVLNAGTVASGSYKSYDPLTGAITTLGITGLAAGLNTDGILTSTSSVEIFATGTATSATSTTLVNSAKTWNTGKWINFQVRITAGTGVGQIRTITANTGTTLTVSAWTVTPDATSQYVIEGNDDFVYFVGNNSVTMYRYSFSGNTWVTMAPTTARAVAPTFAICNLWIQKTGDTNFDDENTGNAGRYLYSFRGGATSNLDRFDITGGTAGAGAWATITYINQAETFGNGSSFDWVGKNIVIRKEATNRLFSYDVVGNVLMPLSTNLYPDGTALVGKKIWINNYSESGVVKINWVYSLLNSSNIVHRMMLI
jgi:hypothetical protein